MATCWFGIVGGIGSTAYRKYVPPFAQSARGCGVDRDSAVLAIEDAPATGKQGLTADGGPTVAPNAGATTSDVDWAAISSQQRSRGLQFTEAQGPKLLMVIETAFLPVLNILKTQ